MEKPNGPVQSNDENLDTNERDRTNGPNSDSLLGNDEIACCTLGTLARENLPKTEGHGGHASE